MFGKRMSQFSDVAWTVTSKLCLGIWFGTCAETFFSKHSALELYWSSGHTDIASKSGTMSHASTLIFCN